MRSLKHDNIVNFIDVFESTTDNDENIYIVMELMNTTLHEILKSRGPLTEQESFQIFESIVKGVDHCHKNGIIHFDLKPQNILVRLDQFSGKIADVKLSDFGLSRKCDEYLFGGLDTLGTIYYFAPEMLKLNK